MNGLFFALSELQIIAGPYIAAAENQGVGSSGPWHPPEWSGPALTMITVPAPTAPGTQGLSITDQIGGQTLPGAPSFQGQPTYLVFDAILRAEHTRELRRTEHPIQTSASSPVTSITDHAYMLPARVTLEIGMSDAMDSFASDLWTSNASKSVSAYQTLVDLQRTRTLVSLTTRLDTYSNMLVESIIPTDTYKTRHGLRATVVFSEVFLADGTAVSSGISFNTSTDDIAQSLSARAQTTASTALGTVQSGSVGSAVTKQFNISTATIPWTSMVPGAGSWSSTNTAGLGSLLG